jgi:hypothetical protein
VSPSNNFSGKRTTVSPSIVRVGAILQGTKLESTGRTHCDGGGTVAREVLSTEFFGCGAMYETDMDAAGSFP